MLVQSEVIPSCSINTDAVARLNTKYVSGSKKELICFLYKVKKTQQKKIKGSID